MSIESIPEFTAPAAKLWAAIPGTTKKLLLANVWCGTCRGSVMIANISGTVTGGDLLLSGTCSNCNGKVARVIEAKTKG